jgi:hypothetical protein
MGIPEFAGRETKDEETKERTDKQMAAKKKKAAAGKGELLISKSRTKASVKKCNVSGDFYGAFDAAARNLLKVAEERALANKRKTLRPQDL